MTEILEVLRAMKDHASRERAALRSLDTRALFDLAAEGEGLARKLGAAMAKQASLPHEVKAFAAEVRALNRGNHHVAARSLQVVRALKPATATPEAPSFVSERA